MGPATKGVVVVLAGFCLTVALGSLYIWALIGAELLRPLSAGGSYAWTIRQVSTPFAIACASFVVGMMIGGSVQDRFGPRWPSTTGGVLIGLGMILASMSEARLAGPNSLGAFMVLGLGIMVGGGAGLTLASVVPAAVKWSVPRRRGLVVGLVIAGFALGPAWLSDAVLAAVRARGVSSVLLVQGIALLAVIVGLSQLLEDPLLGYVPPGSYSDSDGMGDTPLPWAGLPPRRTRRTPAYRALGASSGLVAAATAFLAVRLVLATSSLRPDGLVLVLGVALAGSLGGLLAGILYDRVGQSGLSVVFGLLVVTLAGAAVLATTGHLTAATLLTAASWAGGVVVAWVSTIEWFGTRRAGGNFGLVFAGGSVGLLLGALAAVLSASGESLALTASAARTAIAVVFVLVLGTAVFLASRVRPPVTPPAEDGVGRDRRGSANR